MNVGTAAAVNTAEAARRMGVSFRVLDRWVREDVIASEGVAHGSGSRRSWEPDTIKVGRVLAHLAELGACCDVLALAEPSIRTLLDQAVPPAVIYVNTRGDVDTFQPAFAAWYVNLEDLAALD